jgi:hypothetical protein
LRNKNIPNRLLKAIIDIYDNNRIRIKFNSGISEYTPINRGIRQGCPLSPTLFNIYLNEIQETWESEEIKGIQLSRNKCLNTLLFADDQVIISHSEDKSQKSTHKFNKLINTYGLKISTEKTKTMAFCGPEPIISKIVIDNKIIQQVNVFNYLGCSLSVEGEKDIMLKF